MSETSDYWVDIYDFLGTGVLAPRDRKYRSFEDARDFARSLGLKSETEWQEYCKSKQLPLDIPRAPQMTYNTIKNKGWKGWGDFLDSGNVYWKDREYRSFKEAREFVRSLGLKNVKEWFDYTKSGQLPVDIPTNPNTVYKDKDWKGYGDWLGTGRIANFNLEFRSFEDARDFARSLGLKSGSEWREYCKSLNKPDDIPSTPDQSYKDKGWISMGDWLGTGRIADQYKADSLFLSFKDARAFVRKLNLKSGKEWRQYSSSGKRPDFIPSSPEKVYSKKRFHRHKS